MKKTYICLIGISLITLCALLTGGSKSSCTLGYCGNGRVDFGEECDFGYTGYCDGCVDCKLHDNVCGDGYQCEAEQCDDGDQEGGDGCSSACELEHDMINVPAGSFIMSDPFLEEIWAQTQHEVTLSNDFYMERAEVTNKRLCQVLQWAYNNGHVDATEFTVTDPVSGEELVDLNNYSCEIEFLNDTFTPEDRRDDYPALVVSWYGAASYCDWLSLMEGLAPLYDHTDWSCTVYGSEGYRLPTEAEWEYGAQYDDERIYPWGDEEPTCDHANFDDCVGYTDTVCNHPLGHSALGFCDLAGNVQEWVHDWWSDYTLESQVDPAGPGFGTSRVFHSGRWSYSSLYIRCSKRHKGEPNWHMWDVGFRGAKIGGRPKRLKIIK